MDSRSMDPWLTVAEVEDLLSGLDGDAPPPSPLPDTACPPGDDKPLNNAHPPAQTPEAEADEELDELLGALKEAAEGRESVEQGGGSQENVLNGATFPNGIPLDPYFDRVIQAMEREEAGPPEPRPQSVGSSAVAEFFPELPADSAPWGNHGAAGNTGGTVDTPELHYAYGIVAVDVYAPPGQLPFAQSSLVTRYEMGLSEQPAQNTAPVPQQSRGNLTKEPAANALTAHAPVALPSQLAELHVATDQGSTGQDSRTLNKGELLLVETPAHSYSADAAQTRASNRPPRPDGKSAPCRKEVTQPLKPPAHAEIVDLSMSPDLPAKSTSAQGRRRRHANGETDFTAAKRKGEVVMLSIPSAYPQPKAPQSSAPLLSRGTGRVGRLHKPRPLKPKVSVASTPTTVSMFSRESYQLLTPALAKSLGYLPAAVPTPTPNPSTQLYLAPRRN